MIAIIDYGVGNLGSIQNMLRRTGHKAEVTGDPCVLEKAGKLILPGVGAFDAGMTALRETGLIDVLSDRVLNHKIPVLGVCLGMHLLFGRSEEGELEGLRWLPGEVVRFRQPAGGGKLPVPHMGWNFVRPTPGKQIFANGQATLRFYFVHSYYVTGCAEEHVAGTTLYGTEFVSAVESENIWGSQFHPEKSHKYGIQLLGNFAQA